MRVSASGLSNSMGWTTISLKWRSGRGLVGQQPGSPWAKDFANTRFIRTLPARRYRKSWRLFWHPLLQIVKLRPHYVRESIILHSIVINRPKHRADHRRIAGWLAQPISTAGGRLALDHVSESVAHDLRRGIAG